MEQTLVETLLEIHYGLVDYNLSYFSVLRTRKISLSESDVV